MDVKIHVGFLGLIFSSFFRWWWATITGLASLASLIFVPSQGVILDRFQMFFLVLAISALFFLALSTVYQGWLLYKERWGSLNVIGFYESDGYDTKYVFLLNGFGSIAQNTLIELKRFDAGVEVPIALVEIMERNSKGQYQAKPIWISPGHQRDLKLGKFVVSDLMAEPMVKFRTVQKFINGISSGGTYGQ